MLLCAFRAVAQNRLDRPTLDQLDRDSAWWDPEPEPARYDVMRGSPGVPRDSGGAFEPATEACLADDSGFSSIALGADPQPGEALWFLVCVEGDSCDTGDFEQVAPRDAGIRSSPSSCP